MNRHRYTSRDRALARLHRDLDRAATPTEDEYAALLGRARLRLSARLKAANGLEDEITDDERAAQDVADADLAAFHAYRRYEGLPTSDDYFDRKRAELLERVLAL